MATSRKPLLVSPKTCSPQQNPICRVDVIILWYFEILAISATWRDGPDRCAIDDFVMERSNGFKWSHLRPHVFCTKNVHNLRLGRYLQIRRFEEISIFQTTSMGKWCTSNVLSEINSSSKINHFSVPSRTRNLWSLDPKSGLKLGNSFFRLD